MCVCVCACVHVGSTLTVTGDIVWLNGWVLGLHDIELSTFGLLSSTSMEREKLRGHKLVVPRNFGDIHIFSAEKGCYDVRATS